MQRLPEELKATGQRIPFKNARSFPPAAGGYGTDPNVITPASNWPRILSRHQLRLIAALSDVILPATADQPAPSKIGIAKFFDEWLSAPYPKEQGDKSTILGDSTSSIGSRSASIGSVSCGCRKTGSAGCSTESSRQAVTVVRSSLAFAIWWSARISHLTPVSRQLAIWEMCRYEATLRFQKTWSRRSMRSCGSLACSALA
jgi:hypothetical protein